MNLLAFKGIWKSFYKTCLSLSIRLMIFIHFLFISLIFIIKFMIWATILNHGRVFVGSLTYIVGNYSQIWLLVKIAHCNSLKTKITNSNNKTVLKPFFLTSKKYIYRERIGYKGFSSYITKVDLIGREIKSVRVTIYLSLQLTKYYVTI